MKWIAVNEGLPPLGHKVLVTSNFYGNQEANSNTTCIALRCCQGNDWTEPDSTPFKFPFIVTHWMEIPLPPDKNLD